MGLQLTDDGDALINWDTLGERWLYRCDFGHVAALSLDKLVTDLESVQNKVPQREVDRLKTLESNSSKRMLKSTKSPLAPAEIILAETNMRTIISVIKIQRHWREWLAKRI